MAQAHVLVARPRGHALVGTHALVAQAHALVTYHPGGHALVAQAHALVAHHPGGHALVAKAGDISL